MNWTYTNFTAEIFYFILFTKQKSKYKQINIDTNPFVDYL